MFTMQVDNGVCMWGRIFVQNATKPSRMEDLTGSRTMTNHHPMWHVLVQKTLNLGNLMLINIPLMVQSLLKWTKRTNYYCLLLRAQMLCSKLSDTLKTLNDDNEINSKIDDDSDMETNIINGNKKKEG